MLASVSRWLFPALLYTCVLSVLTLVRWATRAAISPSIVLTAVALNGVMAFGVATGFELADRVRSSARRRWWLSVPLLVAGLALSWHIGSELVGAVSQLESVGYRQAIALALAGGVLLLLVGLRADAFGNRVLGLTVLCAGLLLLLAAQDQYRMQLREARYAGVSAAFLVLTGMLGVRAAERALRSGRAHGAALGSVLAPLCVFVVLSLFTSEFAARRLYFAGLFPGRFIFALYYPEFAWRTARATTRQAQAPAETFYTAAPSRALADELIADEIVVLAVVDAARYDAFVEHVERPASKLHAAWEQSCHAGAAYAPASDTVGSLARMLLRPGTNELWPDVVRAAGVHASLTIDRLILDKLDRRLPSGLSRHFDVVAPLQREVAEELQLESVAASVEKLLRLGSGRQFVWAHLLEVHEWLEGAPDAGRETYDARMAKSADELAEIVALLQREQRRATLIVSADHGEGIDHFSTRTHGQFLYEPLVRTPLMIWSNTSECPARLRALADKPPLTTLALGRLVLDQLGIASDAGLPTVSQLASAPIVMHGGIQDAVIRWPHKLIVSPWFMELFDLSSDPHEQRNLIDERAELASELRALLR